jgi:hypothetical protein
MLGLPEASNFRVYSVRMKFEEIHQSALLAVSEFKSAEKRLLLALIEVEKNSVHLRMGFSSLFQYAVSSLGLSEAVSYNAIAVARKLREIPALPLEVGVSKIRKVVSVMTPENQAEWIPKLKTLSSRALEKEVARVNPKASTPERASYTSEKRLDLRLGLDEELMLKLRRAQDQVSQSLGKPASLEETLGQVVTFYLKRKDPLEKARRVIAKKGQTTETLNKLFTGTVRAPIPKAIEHQVRLRFRRRGELRRKPRNALPRAPSALARGLGLVDYA